jgi:multidrug efflux system outer membrane protein
LLPTLLLSGCMVWHNYMKPEVVLPDAFRSQISVSDAQSFADLPWWTVFNDQALQALIAEALTNNYNLQVAVAKIEQARALVGVAQSEGKPQIGYEVFGSGQNALVPQRRSPDTVTYGAFGGLLNAAWEFDVWGRIRYQTESAQANLLGQEDVRRGVILTLVSDIAADYFRLLELDRNSRSPKRVHVSTRIRSICSGLDLDAGRDSRLPS